MGKAYKDFETVNLGGGGITDLHEFMFDTKDFGWLF